MDSRLPGLGHHVPAPRLLRPMRPPYFQWSEQERRIVKTPYAARLHFPSTRIDDYGNPVTAADDEPTDVFETERVKLYADTAEFHPLTSWHSEASNEFSLVRRIGGFVAITVPFDPEVVDWNLMIGRGPHADIRFSSPAISRRHLRIEAKDGFFYVTRISGSRVWVDGRELSKGERALINPGQIISLSDSYNNFVFSVKQNLLFFPKKGPPQGLERKKRQPRVKALLHGRPKNEFFPMLRKFDLIKSGPMSGVSIPRQLEEAEVYIGREKRPYIGNMQFWVHKTGQKFIRLLQEDTGKIYLFSMDEIISIRDKNHDVTAFTRVKNPQYKDKDYNQSGFDDSKMQVMVDFTDPRLSGFIKDHILSIERDLFAGRIDKMRAAQLVRNVVSKYVKYDKPRTYGKFENRLYNLGEFIKKAVCNERAMILQVILQYLGIKSSMEKGYMPNGSRHAWVRTDDPDIKYQMVLDPQQHSAFTKWDARFHSYVDDHTPFVKGKDADANGNGLYERIEAHSSWQVDEPF